MYVIDYFNENKVDSFIESLLAKLLQPCVDLLPILQVPIISKIGMGSHHCIMDCAIIKFTGERKIRFVFESKRDVDQNAHNYPQLIANGIATIMHQESFDEDLYLCLVTKLTFTFMKLRVTLEQSRNLVAGDKANPAIVVHRLCTLDFEIAEERETILWILASTL
jgi:hypothetical protein